MKRSYFLVSFKCWNCPQNSTSTNQSDNKAITNRQEHRKPGRSVYERCDPATNSHCLIRTEDQLLARASAVFTNHCVTQLQLSATKCLDKFLWLKGNFRDSFSPQFLPRRRRRHCSCHFQLGPEGLDFLRLRWNLRVSFPPQFPSRRQRRHCSCHFQFGPEGLDFLRLRWNLRVSFPRQCSSRRQRQRPRRFCG